MTILCGRQISASPRTRSGATDHSSSSSRTSVSAGLSPRSTAPPAPSAQRPAHEATHGARRPASQRPSAERVTHSAAMLREASPATSRSAQRSGCSSIAMPSPSTRKSTSRAETPSWLGEPRSRSAVIAASAASVCCGEGSNSSSRQCAEICSSSHGPRARISGSSAAVGSVLVDISEEGARRSSQA